MLSNIVPERCVSVSGDPVRPSLVPRQFRPERKAVALFGTHADFVHKSSTLK